MKLLIILPLRSKIGALGWPADMSFYITFYISLILFTVYISHFYDNEIFLKYPCTEDFNV